MTPLLMLTIAVCDLIPVLRVPRLAGRGRTLRRAAYLVWLPAVVVLVAVSAPDMWWAGATAALGGVLWLLLRRSTPAAPVVLLVVLVGGALVEATALGAVGAGIPAELTWAAVLLFLTESSNRITRAVLDLTGRDGGDADGLRGGRVIGPLERLLMAVLALFGAQAVIAALAAAKGIVRFPAISGDRPGGTRAEEFLIGSLTSWGLAGGAALLLWSAQIT